MMARKCSHCGHNGHNSRTCTTQRDFVAGVGSSGVRLFGVQLYVVSTPPMKRSFSMDCLSCTFPNSSSSSSPSSSPSPSPSPSPSTSSLVSIDELSEKNSNIGYLSDGLAARSPERKKGIPWTEEEHKLFLAGLLKFGKGDWRGISRNFVTTRTPTQVASHAQKYFLRQNTLKKQKRRSSLFDVAPNSDHKPRENDTPKLKVMLSLNQASDGVIHTTAINLLAQGDAQQTELPSHTGHVSKPVSSNIRHSPLDLKLSINSSSSMTELSINPSPSNSLFLEKIRAA